MKWGFLKQAEYLVRSYDLSLKLLQTWLACQQRKLKGKNTWESHSQGGIFSLERDEGSSKKARPDDIVSNCLHLDVSKNISTI